MYFIHMVAQTTDSGSDNHILANELERMFMEDDDPIFWNSRRNQIRCYCHKLALTVKHGFEMIGVGVGRTKPSIPKGRKLYLIIPDNSPPPPKIIVEKSLNQPTATADPDFDEQDKEVDDIDSDCKTPPNVVNPHPSYIDSDDSDDESEANEALLDTDPELLNRALNKVSILM